MKKMIEIFSSAKDGSLPEITIEFGSVKDRDSITQQILENSLIAENSMINIHGHEVKCNAFSLKELIGNLSTGHHLNIKNFRNLPELGLGFFDKGLAVDFYTGKHWTALAVRNLCQFLSEIKEKYKTTKIILDEEGIRFSPDQIEYFNSYFKKNG